MESQATAVACKRDVTKVPLLNTKLSELCVQGVILDKYVELDFQEVTQRKCMTISLKAELKGLLERDNAAIIEGNAGCINSLEYSLFPADLRDLEQVRCLLNLSFRFPVWFHWALG